jgi:hypothetical protein
MPIHRPTGHSARDELDRGKGGMISPLFPGDHRCDRVKFSKYTGSSIRAISRLLLPFEAIQRHSVSPSRAGDKHPRRFGHRRSRRIQTAKSIQAIKSVGDGERGGRGLEGCREPVASGRCREPVASGRCCSLSGTRIPPHSHALALAARHACRSTSPLKLPRYCVFPSKHDVLCLYDALLPCFVGKHNALVVVMEPCPPASIPRTGGHASR